MLGVLGLKASTYRVIEQNSRYQPSYFYSLEKRQRKSFHRLFCEAGNPDLPKIPGNGMIELLLTFHVFTLNSFSLLVMAAHADDLLYLFDVPCRLSCVTRRRSLLPWPRPTRSVSCSTRWIWRPPRRAWRIQTRSSRQSGEIAWTDTSPRTSRSSRRPWQRRSPTSWCTGMYYRATRLYIFGIIGVLMLMTIANVGFC